MARSKAQLTHAKRTRELARLEKRARKQEKKDARKLAASDPTAETRSGIWANGDVSLWVGDDLIAPVVRQTLLEKADLVKRRLRSRG